MHSLISFVSHHSIDSALVYPTVENGTVGAVSDPLHPTTLNQLDLGSFSAVKRFPVRAVAFHVLPVDEVANWICSVARPGARIFKWAVRACGTVISFSLTRNRYCENIDREHRHNNILVICDMAKAVWWQKCFDPDCRSFCSKVLRRYLENKSCFVVDTPKVV